MTGTDTREPGGPRQRDHLQDDLSDQVDALLGVGLATLHGMASGLLAGSNTPASASEALGRLLDLDEKKVEASALAGFVEALAREMAADDLGFAPLLPDDDTPLSRRVEQLGQWCAGFVAGFADAVGEETLADDVVEALDDLQRIAEVDADDLSERAAEFDYFAVAEHARVAALLIHARGGDGDGSW